MGMFDKLDELISKLDEAPAEEASEAAEVEAPQDEVSPVNAAEVVEQDESPEDAPTNEAVEKLVRIVESQQGKIDSLNNQIAQLVKGGANISDGKSSEVVTPPADVPDDYQQLKDLDYSMKDVMHYGTN